MAHGSEKIGSWLLGAILTCGLIVCGAIETASADVGACEGPEHPIAASIRDWFSSLESRAPEVPAIDRFLAEARFEFPLSEGEDPGPKGLRGWVSDLRSAHSRVEYRLDGIRAESAGDGLLRARFELERKAVDAEGYRHIARRQQTWLIREVAGAPPAVLRIDERRLLSFPGTGPQIVCF